MWKYAFKISTGGHWNGPCGIVLWPCPCEKRIPSYTFRTGRRCRYQNRAGSKILENRRIKSFIQCAVWRRWRRYVFRRKAEYPCKRYLWQEQGSAAHSYRVWCRSVYLLCKQTSYWDRCVKPYCKIYPPRD